MLTLHDPERRNTLRVFAGKVSSVRLAVIYNLLIPLEILAVHPALQDDDGSGLS